MSEKRIHDASQFQMFTADMQREIRQSCRDFIAEEPLSLVIGSWNVNAKEEESENMSQWLVDAEVQRADVVVVGLQEVIELSPTNTVIGSNITGSNDNSSAISSYSCERWLNLLLSHLNHDSRPECGCGFALVESLSMVGIAIFVFTREDWQTRVHNVQARSIPRGGGGLLGNKGAVCVCFEVNDTSFCFCSAHLCAHREDFLKRNEDFRVIYNTPVFQPPGFAAVQRVKGDSGQVTRNVSTASAAGRLKSKLRAAGDARAGSDDVYLRKVKDHDLVFFFGDLNYRVAEGFEITEVYDVLELSSGCLMSDVNSVLLEQDQLHIQRKENLAFQGFCEAPINFKPTYQYLAGTDSYDRRPDRKLRCPGWCDRILWKTNHSLLLPCNSAEKPSNSSSEEEWSDSIGSVRALSYRRGENIISDHKPISASFVLTTLKVDEQAKQAALLRAAAAWREKSVRLASVAATVTPQFVVVPNCSGVDDTKTVQLFVSNPALNGAEVSVLCPSWLHPLPGKALSVTVLPSSDVTLEFAVDFNDARRVIMRDQPALVQPAELLKEGSSSARPGRRVEGVTSNTDCVDLSCFLEVTVRDLDLAVEKESTFSRTVKVPVRCSFSVQ